MYVAPDSLETNLADSAIASGSEIIGHAIRRTAFHTPKRKHYRMLYTVTGSQTRVLRVLEPGQKFTNEAELNLDFEVFEPGLRFL